MTHAGIAHPHLQSERLSLEPQTLRGFDAWFALERARDERGHADLTEDDAWLRLCAREGMWSAFGSGFYFLRDRHSGALVGEAGLQWRRRGLGPRFDGLPEAAWAIDARHRRQGLASEAMREILRRYADTARSADCTARVRVVALIASRNAASLRVAERLGFASFERRIFNGEAHGLFAWEDAGATSATPVPIVPRT